MCRYGYGKTSLRGTENFNFIIVVINSEDGTIWYGWKK